ncbi:hypothetical protein BpHYR1_007429, partial [Brachionus plicatilis]
LHILPEIINNKIYFCVVVVVVENTATQNGLSFYNLLQNLKIIFKNQIALVPVESSDAAKLTAKKALSKQSNQRLFDQEICDH